MGTTQGYCLLFWTNPGRGTLQNSNLMATYLLSHKLLKKGKQDTLGIIGKEWMNSLIMFSYELQCMDTLVLSNQQKLTFINSVQILLSRGLTTCHDQKGQMVRESQRNLCCQYALMMMVMMIFSSLQNSMKLCKVLKGLSTEFFDQSASVIFIHLFSFFV